MKEIPLTRGYVALVGDCDFERVSFGRKWQALVAHRTDDSVRVYAYRGVGQKKREYLHRMILNAPPSKQVDHKDGDGLNNVRSNLRLGNNRQNQMNKKPCLVRCGSPTSSRFKGVYQVNDSGRWCAGIRVKGKTVYLGVFAREEDAARAYDEMARKLFGRWARENSPLSKNKQKKDCRSG